MGTCLCATCFAPTAHALGDVTIEVAAKGGYATNPASTDNSGQPNLLGLGFGGRAGLAFRNELYLGADVADYPGGSLSALNVRVGGGAVTQSFSTQVLMYGAEAGYGVRLIDLLTLRATLGFGDATVSVTGQPISSTYWYLRPGVTALVDFGHVFAGADVNMLILSNRNYDQAAFVFDAQVGVKF
jgi:hypothetical protein